MLSVPVQAQPSFTDGSPWSRRSSRPGRGGILAEPRRGGEPGRQSVSDPRRPGPGRPAGARAAAPAAPKGERPKPVRFALRAVPLLGRSERGPSGTDDLASHQVTLVVAGRAPSPVRAARSSTLTDGRLNHNSSYRSGGPQERTTDCAAHFHSWCISGEADTIESRRALTSRPTAVAATTVRSGHLAGRIWPETPRAAPHVARVAGFRARNSRHHDGRAVATRRRPAIARRSRLGSGARGRIRSGSG